MKLLLRRMMGIAFVFAIALSVSAQNTTTVTDRILEQATRADGDLRVLLLALTQTDLLSTLDDPTADLTLFAPQDEAFTRYLQDQGLTINELLADPDALATLLRYHISPVSLQTFDLAPVNELETLYGEPLTVVALVEDITLNDSAVITSANITADNGVIHIVDQVLLPSLAAEANGEDPSTSQTATLAQLLNDEQFSEFRALLQDADSLAQLDDAAANLTIFVPTNEALAAAENPVDVDLHIVDGILRSDDLILQTSLNDSIAITVFDTGIVVNAAIITTLDIEATNGVLHILNAPLMPLAEGDASQD